ncbi:hypothetical protein BH20ACT20_BH20ACT20_03160 [soil metagenome]
MKTTKTRPSANAFPPGPKLLKDEAPAEEEQEQG